MKFFIYLFLIINVPIYGQDNGYLTFQEAIQDSTRLVINDANYVFKPDYLVKIKFDKSFNDALKSIKNKPEKFLIVIYDSANSETYKNYLKYIGNYVIETQKHMYYGYLDEYDRFEFCFIKNDDKPFFEKFSEKQKNIIAYYNSTGECLYYLERPIEDEIYFYEWDTLYRDLINANKLVTSDKIFSDENVTIKDLKKAFLTASDVFYWETGDQLFVDKNEIIEFNYYNYLDEAKQSYMLKTGKDQVIQKWIKTIEFLNKENTIDNKILIAIFSELSRNGFSKRLFNESSKLLRDDDFFAFDYILRNYDEISEKTREDFNYLYLNEHDLMFSIMDPLRDTMDKENKPNGDLVKKAIDYFKKFNALNNGNTLVERYFVYSLSFTAEVDEFIKNYENYFEKFVNDSDNLIVNLDKFYKQENEIREFLDWDNYKSEFVSMANTSGQFILSNSKEKEKFKKAIYWLETTLPIDEKNYTYLSTLSKLYYSNGDIAKAITTSVKAVGLAKQDKTIDDETLSELIKTQKSIKNGTYRYQDTN